MKPRNGSKAGRCALLLLASIAITTAAEAQIYQTGLVMANQRMSSQDGQILTAVTSAFLDSKRFDVIERSRLDAIFTERDLQDFINGTHADLSSLEGVDLLGLVSYSTQSGPAGQQVFFIDVRLTEVRTGRVFGTLSSRRDTFEPPYSPHRAGLYLLANIREQFPPEGIVVDVQGRQVIIDLGVESGLKKGDELEVIREGRVLFHPTTGDPLPAVESVVGVLRVREPAVNMSTCLLKKDKDGPPILVEDRVRLRPKNENLRKIYNRIPMLRNRG